MSDEYFVIYNLESGLRVRKINNINEFLEDFKDEHFISDFPPKDKWGDQIIDRESLSNSACGGPSDVILIKGKIVKPKVVKVIERLEID